MAKNRKLGRTSDIRKSMLRSLATEVIVYGKVETTVTDLHARRQAAADMHKVVDEATGKTAVQILFDDVAPKFKDVNGGYTTILKTYNRKGDNAPMAILSLTK